MAVKILRSTTLAGAALFMVFGTTACATKKYVRQTVTPVENRVSGVETKTADHASAIGELENNVSRADEKASEADRRAREAGTAAERANQAALTAHNRADAAYSRIGEVVENFDNYQLVTTENVLFKLNQSKLTKEAMEQLDQAVSSIRNNKNYVLEINGFTDRTGSRERNLELSRARADAVVRYLTTQHGIPLRKIHMIGVGEETANVEDQRSREGRQQARKVEIKVYTLSLGEQQASMNTQGQNSSGSTSNDMSGNQGSMNQSDSMNQGGSTNQGGSMNQGSMQNDATRARTNQ